MSNELKTAQSHSFLNENEGEYKRKPNAVVRMLDVDAELANVANVKMTDHCKTIFQ